MSQSRPLRWLLPAAGLLLLLGAAAWLRWRYIQDISLYVDEFTTLWAAKRVLATGAPLMPSGVLYTRGLLAVYVTALAAAIGGLSYTVGRLPSLLFGLGAIVAVWALGRREWNSRVAWLAALGLVLLPEAVVWSGRARFYAQLQFFVLLALWAAYASIQFRYLPGSAPGSAGEHDDDQPTRWGTWLFALLFVLALFSQEQTILLYPPVVLATLWWRGWRWFLRPQVWPAHLACIAAMGVRYAIEIVGQPGYFETIQAERPYVGFFFDPAATWRTYAPLLTAPERLPWTLFGLLAVVVALVVLGQGRWRMRSLPLFHQATLFFVLQFGFVLAFILLLVGGQWRETRYLYLVQPLWLLVGAAGAIWLVDRLLSGPVWRWAATGVLALFTVAILWQPAQRVLAQQVEGYDKVLAYVAAQRQPGDVVMSPQPPACALVLGPCDYYAVQKVYEEFVVPQHLQAGAPLVDRWSGAKLLKDAKTLEQVIRTAPTVWFVTDRFRLATRYDEAFLRTVLEQFDIAFEERGVMALRAKGWREPPPTAAEQALNPPLRTGPLELTQWAHGPAAPGQELAVTLTWRGVEPISRQINTSVRLIAPDGSTVAQKDGPPAYGIIPTNLFFGTPLPDAKALTLPPGLKPGTYQVQVVAYDVETVAPVGDALTVGTVEVR